MQTAKSLIRLGGCQGWSESLLGAHANLLVLSCCGSLCFRIKGQKQSMRVVPRVRRQSLKCFKMTFDTDITLHVCTFTCVFNIVGIHKSQSNIISLMVAMTTLPLHVRSASKFLPITLTWTAQKVLIFMQCQTYLLLHKFAKPLSRPPFHLLHSKMLWIKIQKRDCILWRRRTWFV